ncbi:hypothetical protein JT180_03135 [Helicobacter pylori]|nr:hypothetical protein [Helicobacter pylori]
MFIGVAVRMGVWLLGGIVLDLVVKLLRGYFNGIALDLVVRLLRGYFKITFPLTP